MAAVGGGGGDLVFEEIGVCGVAGYLVRVEIQGCGVGFPDVVEHCCVEELWGDFSMCSLFGGVSDSMRVFVFGIRMWRMGDAPKFWGLRGRG